MSPPQLQGPLSVFSLQVASMKMFQIQFHTGFVPRNATTVKFAKYVGVTCGRGQDSQVHGGPPPPAVHPAALNSVHWTWAGRYSLCVVAGLPHNSSLESPCPPAERGPVSDMWHLLGRGSCHCAPLWLGLALCSSC